MVQAASLFNQLLQHFPRTEFASLVKKHLAERAAKGFTCWTQFVAMTFCQLAHADSLREICNGLACSEGKLVHLGITNAPNKSTLSYANEHHSGNAPTPNGLKSKGCYRHRVNQGLGRRRLSVPSASARRRTGARGVTGRCHVLRAQLADVAPRHGGTARRTGRRFRSDASYGTLETMPSSAV